MKHTRKPFSGQLIKAHFGSEARVLGVGGWYRVTTPGGDVVSLGPGVRGKVIFGGEDVYRNVTELLGECWGSVTVYAHGSRTESVLAHLAHCEAAGVPVRVSFRNRGATFLRWCVFLGIVLAGIRAGIDSTWPGAALLLLVAACVFGLLRHSARRIEQRKAEEMGLHYPRVWDGGSGAARRDDAAREGWL